MAQFVSGKITSDGFRSTFLRQIHGEQTLKPMGERSGIVCRKKDSFCALPACFEKLTVSLYV
ncbi:MAG: hypothetical protein Q4D81_06055, partial [Eubacteriales bacterium]|nr:hypothetical protein [Eubacteriales bacterium]